VLFALLHPFPWEWNSIGFTGHFGAKASINTTAILATSPWLYTVRLFGLNANRSLLTCFVAHNAKDSGVLAIKYFQGFVGG